MSKIVMGLSVGHNRGAAITVDGILKVAIANERITRIKTDRSDCLPFEAMDYCINTLDITYDDITIFVYNTTEHANNIPNEFTWHTNQHLDKLSFIPHHIAHAYSTFHASGYKDAVVVVADAMGSVYNDVTPIKEWYTLDESDLGIGYEWAEGFSIYEFKDGVAFKSPEPLYKKWVRFPFSNEHEGSIGYLYGVGARQLVYNEKSNSWPAGKLMGLASYADPKYLEGIQNYSTRTLTDLEVPAFRIMGDVTHKDDFQSKANVAGIYQREQELNSIHLVEMASRISESKNICVAGGSFLNCNTNELIIKSELFEGMYFLPPADDSGIAIGCAFAKSNSESFKPTGKFLSPYTGKTYSNEEIEEATASFNNIIVTKLKPGEASMQAAALISTNKVIGWMQDGSESGPRALGNRSILANPCNKWMVEYINSDIKKREWYRPFAPSVLYDKQAEIFELDTYSPYMMVTTKVKKEWRDKIPAVTHFDSTARYQSVTKDNNKKYYDLISNFNKITGVPVVLNTSFNGPEEPIVETPTDALNTMLKHDLFAVIINDYLITRA